METPCANLTLPAVEVPSEQFSAALCVQSVFKKVVGKTADAVKELARLNVKIAEAVVVPMTVMPSPRLYCVFG